MTREKIVELVETMFEEETSDRQRAKMAALLLAEHLNAQNRIADALERLAQKASA